MVNISISTPFKKMITKDWLIKTVEIALHFEEKDPQNYDLTILIRNDDFIRKLKFKYFGIDESTDVLSFPAGDEDPETHRIYLGDVVISFPQTERQASAAGKTTKQEISLLVVHGILHLLGYDHIDDPSQDLMWKKQEMILNQLGNL